MQFLKQQDSIEKRLVFLWNDVELDDDTETREKQEVSDDATSSEEETNVTTEDSHVPEVTQFPLRRYC
jgi:hypothetical protein